MSELHFGETQSDEVALQKLEEHRQRARVSHFLSVITCKANKWTGDDKASVRYSGVAARRAQNKIEYISNTCKATVWQNCAKLKAHPLQI